MPTKPNTICTFTGCHTYAVRGTSRCVEHKKITFEGFNRTHPRAGLYHTTRWRKLRRLHLRLNPLCMECKRHDRVTVAAVLDHIQPVSRGGSFWAPTNHQGLCALCHNTKSAKERKGRGV